MKKQLKNNQKGFTLIEMMIVMVIIGVLIVLVFPKASDVLSTAQTTGCEAYDESVKAQQTTNLLLGKDENDGIDESKREKVCKDTTLNNTK